MRALILPLLALLAAPAMGACRHSKDIEQVFPATGLDAVQIYALAGILEVTGDTAATDIVFDATACTDEEKYLDRMNLDVEQDGDTLVLTVDIPYDDRDFDADYAHMDIMLSVPASLPVDIRDSSGDIVTRGANIRSVDDSSGDIRVSDNTGSLKVEDSSGSITIRAVQGDVEVEDSSGDIEVRNVRGNVRVPRDSSGDIEIEGVDQVVEIERDSSGDIEVDSAREVIIGSDGSGDIDINDVSGSVRIDSDGSGRVRVEDVAGDFTLSSKGNGDIRIRDVEGTVSSPR